MAVKSTFDLKFAESDCDEGLELAKAIGPGMSPLNGHINQEVIQDVDDPGPVMVNTLWATSYQSQRPSLREAA